MEDPKSKNKVLMKYVDFMKFKDIALKDFLAIKDRSRFKGMNRELNPEERRMLAFYSAAISILVEKGLVKEGVNFHEVFEFDEYK